MRRVPRRQANQVADPPLTHKLLSGQNNLNFLSNSAFSPSFRVETPYSWFSMSSFCIIISVVIRPRCLSLRSVFVLLGTDSSTVR